MNKQEALDYLEERICYWLDEMKFGTARTIEKIKEQVENDLWEDNYEIIKQVGIEYRMNEIIGTVYYY